jgi:hypothetical protein
LSNRKDFRFFFLETKHLKGRTSLIKTTFKEKSRDVKPIFQIAEPFENWTK